MRFCAFIFLAGVFLACSSTPHEIIRSPMGIDLRSYRRFAIMPFGDRQGLGRIYARELTLGLSDMEFDVVTGEQLGVTLKRLNIRSGVRAEMQLGALMTMRREARIDALIFGAVDCSPWTGRRRASLIVIDTIGGQRVFEMLFEPEKCGDAAAAKAIAKRMVGAMKDRMKRREIKSIDDITF